MRSPCSRCAVGASRARAAVLPFVRSFQRRADKRRLELFCLLMYVGVIALKTQANKMERPGAPTLQNGHPVHSGAATCYGESLTCEDGRRLEIPDENPGP
jgi:hypothetical protein